MIIKPQTYTVHADSTDGTRSRQFAYEVQGTSPAGALRTAIALFGEGVYLRRTERPVWANDLTRTKPRPTRNTTRPAAHRRADR